MWEVVVVVVKMWMKNSINLYIREGKVYVNKNIFKVFFRKRHELFKNECYI